MSEEFFGLTPEQANMLARADIKSELEKCVVNGKLVKPLPASLRKVVHAVAQHGVSRKYARNKAELAQALGISRPTLYSLMAEQDDARPKDGNGENKYDVNAWKIYAAPLIKVPIRDAPMKPKDAVAIKRGDVQIRKLEYDLAVAMRDYLKTDEIDNSIDSANAIVERELRKKFETELPPMLEGLRAGAIKALMREALDEVLAGLPKAFKKAGMI